MAEINKLSERLNYLRNSFYAKTGKPPNMVILGEEIYKILKDSFKDFHINCYGNKKDPSYNGMAIVRIQDDPYKIEVGRFSTETEY